MSDYFDENMYSEPEKRTDSTMPGEQPQGFPEVPEHQSEKPQKKKKGRAGAIIALALCCSLLGGILGAGGVILARNLGKAPVEDRRNSVSVMVESSRKTSQLQTAQVDTGKEMTAAEVYAANVHSTVGITTSITTNYWGFQTNSAASGSGFIISDDGYILTNHHVIEGANSITVTMYDGSAFDAALIGYDQSNDIAVLKIQAEGLTPVVLGDSDAMNVGDSVVAIGNPLGELTFSLTAGLISAKDRQITMSGGTTMTLIQTDAAINSGNSGGALFNMYGEVVGVTNAKYSSSSSGASIDNIGFAIPINTVRPIVESIIEKGYVSKPYIGVTVSNVSSESQLYGLPQGAAVQSVTEGGPAEKAGLQRGDIITSANDTEITGSSDLVSMVRKMAVGDTLNVTVYRQGQTMSLAITVEEQIQSALEEESQPVQQSQSSSQGGSPFGYFRGW